MDFLNELNPSQLKAVEHIAGPSLVIAGAGSGKTRVLTYKIAYLLQKGVKPWSIMALTFTNKAAREMKERIGRLVGMDLASHLYMGTFHSIFSRILRAEAEHLGYTNNFTIYDENDSRSLLKAIVKEMKLDDKTYKPAAVHSRISMAKNNLVTAEDYCNDREIFQQNLQARMPETGRIYNAYVQRCRQANAMDFDDLLMLTFQLFNEHDDIRRKYADRFDFILVDEYQDTNHVQMNIVKQLSREKMRVCAVGDDSQSIYSFRGANIGNILGFQQQFATPDGQEAQLFKLEQNYRSTQNIVRAANSLIKHNRHQIPKEVFSENDEGERLLYKPAYSDKEEALIVCRDIQRIHREEECPYSDFAILYRTNAQSRSFEEELRKQNVPYRIYGGLSFYQRKEIKDIIAYFRLVANPDDEEAFKRIINYPARGIGATTVARIAECAQNGQTSFWNVISEPARYALNVNRGALAKLETFRQMISGFVEKTATTDVSKLGEYIIRESGIYADLFASRDADDLARQENLEEFLSSMQAFVESRREEGREDAVYLTDYLQDVALLTDFDSKGDDDEPRVSLMTVHAAKGLEFATVFVVGLEENIFPSPLAAEIPSELEEERRLLYVAITRAEKHCILTNAKNRWRYGKMEFDNPSRFLKDIDPKLIDEQNEKNSSIFSSGRTDGGYGRRMPWDEDDVPEWRKPAARPRTEPAARPSAAAGFKPLKSVEAARRILQQEATATTAAGTLHEGCKIEHQRFGMGTVLRIEGTGENAKATVQFVHAGTKQLLLKFAKFQIVV